MLAEADPDEADGGKSANGNQKAQGAWTIFMQELSGRNGRRGCFPDRTDRSGGRGHRRARSGTWDAIAEVESLVFLPFFPFFPAGGNFVRLRENGQRFLAHFAIAEVLVENEQFVGSQRALVIGSKNFRIGTRVGRAAAQMASERLVKLAVAIIKRHSCLPS